MSPSTVAGKLDGYKTIIGGTLLILLGSLALFIYFFPSFDSPQLQRALEFFSAGFTTLGIGGKLNKVKNAIEESK